MGRKFEQSLEDAHPFDFLDQVESDQSDFLHGQLTATEGALVTSVYNIELQRVALDEQRLNDWHSAVERSEYLAIKHMQIRRQQGLPTEKPLP